MSSQLPSAGSIRQKLRSILQEQILPELRERAPSHLYSAQLPMKAPAGFVITELPIPPLEESAASADYPTGLRWDEVGVHAIQFPVLCYVLSGEMDLRIGVTTEMLKKTARPKRQCGVYVVSLPTHSYSFILFDTARSSLDNGRFSSLGAARTPGSSDEIFLGARVTNRRALPYNARL